MREELGQDLRQIGETAHLSLRGLALEGLKLLHLAVPRVEVAEEDAPLRRRTVDEAVPKA